MPVDKAALVCVHLASLFTIAKTQYSVMRWHLTEERLRLNNMENRTSAVTT
jgi:hypothetical protein